MLLLALYKRRKEYKSSLTNNTRTFKLYFALIINFFCRWCIPKLYLLLVDRISPTRSFLLCFHCLFTFTRPHLVEDNCRAKRFCLRKDEESRMDRTRRERGRKRTVWAPDITATVSAASGGTKEYISILFHRFVLVPIPWSLLPRPVFLLFFVRQLLELTYPKEDPYVV